LPEVPAEANARVSWPALSSARREAEFWCSGGRTPDPAGKPPWSGAPPPNQGWPASASHAPPVPRPPATRSRQTVLIAVVIAVAALACVPVLWFVFVLGAWVLGGGGASPPGAAGTAGGAPLTKVVFSPDETLVAFVDVPAASATTHVTVASAATGKMITTVTDPDVAAAAISPDDTALAILDIDGTAYLRDISTGQRTAILPGPGGDTGQGQAVAFRADGKLLAVADASSAIDLWNPATGHLTASFTYPGTGNILGLAFSPDGKTLAVFDDNNHTYVLAAVATTPSQMQVRPGSPDLHSHVQYRLLRRGGHFEPVQGSAAGGGPAGRAVEH
jgi:hypothetical protein